MIELKNVSKKILNNKVLDDISLNIEKGKLYLLLGANGSGKTMLLRMLCNLIKPSSGEIYRSQALTYGVIIENPGFLYDETAYFNLKYLANINKKINKEIIYSYMKRFGLYEYKDMKVKKYSLGMRQKLAVIQAIMEQPDILLLDEPFNALDESSIRLLIDELVTLNKQYSTTIVIALHDVEKVISLSPDAKIYMNQGKIEKIIQ